jgi:hypothetical protein
VLKAIANSRITITKAMRTCDRRAAALASQALLLAIMPELWCRIWLFMAVPRLREEALGHVALDLATAELQFFRVLLLGKQSVANDGQPKVNKSFLRP